MARPYDSLEKSISVAFSTIDKNSVYEPNTGCLLWTGNHSKGYGLIGFRRRHWRVHRLVMELKVGKIPKDMVVMHKCDTPSCCNINHLKLGTVKENMQDMYAKKRNKIVGKVKTHCHRGHEWSAENTVLYPNRGSRGSRICRACRNINNSERYKK